MKNQLLAFALTAAVLKSIFIPQVASAQSSRLWATYYAGTISGEASSVATDAAGNVYLAGTANSPGLASGGFQDTLHVGGFGNAFLVKFNANGNRLWATYYGGTIGTSANSVATDAAGNVYMSGTTQDTVGIASPGGFRNTFMGNKVGNQNYPVFDAFLVKFDANGNRLWATYYNIETDSGYPQPFDNAIATDAAGNVYMESTTNSDTGIASGGFQNIYKGTSGYFGLGGDAFLVKFDANGNRLWSTYYGASGYELGRCVATDRAGNVYLGGTTNSTDSIASGGFQNSPGNHGAQFGYMNAFLVKFNANGNRLWATYYGGLESDYVEDGVESIATDALDNVYFTGVTCSTDSIASGGFQDTLVGTVSNAYLIKLNATGNRIWATYYGGVNGTNGQRVTTDAVGNVYMAGATNDTSGIASGGFQDSFPQANSQKPSAYVVKFDANGYRECATYYGKNYIDVKFNCLIGLALDTTGGNVYLCGSIIPPDTNNIASDGFQNTSGGGYEDPYLVKFASCSSFANFQSSDTIFCTYTCINYTDLTTNATSWQWSFPGGIPSSSTLQNPQGVCYDSTGTFNAKLIASNSLHTDSIEYINFIKVFASPLTPVITQHQDTLFCSTDSTYTSYQWYDNTVLIPGATDTTLLISHSGNYNIGVSNKNGCKISVGINIVLGIQNYSNDNHIVLSPNPVTNSLNIYLKKNINDGILSIYNVLGEKIFTSAFNGSTFSLSFGERRGEAAFSTGVYFVQITNETERWTGRFVKE